MRFVLLIIALGLYGTILAQTRNNKLHGYVTDKSSGEALIGVNIQIGGTTMGTSTNRYGFYSIDLPGDSAVLIVSMVGYARHVVAVHRETSGSLNFELVPETRQLSEITITATEDAASEIHSPGPIRIGREEIMGLPPMLGEADPLKFLQVMPGMKQGSEGSAGLYVRGGTPDQNLILLDGVPVYNVYHLFGFISVFNMDAIKDVQLYKSGIPARYDSRLSSVIDIVMREGNMKEPKKSFSVGPVSSSITYETPIVRDRSSLLITGRRTWLDGVYRLLSTEQMGLNFYDLSAKLNLHINERNRLYGSFYGSRDKFFHLHDEYGSKSEFSFRWGNLTNLVRWTSQLRNNLFLINSMHYSKYHFNQVDSYKSRDYEQSRKVNSNIEEASFNSSLDYYPSNRHELKLGIRVANRKFKPETAVYRNENNDFYRTPDEKKSTVLYDIYLEDLFKPFQKMEVHGGIRNSIYNLQRKTFVHLQPRLALRYKLREDIAIKGDYNYIVQPLHLLTNTTLGQPTDLWVPATQRSPSEKSSQYSVGAIKKWATTPYELHLDIYYRGMKNVIEYKEGANYLFGVDEGWEDKIESGTGTSRGIEFLLKKDKGRLNGFIGYTWSSTDRHFEHINNGMKFPFKYDRRHEGAALASWNFSPDKKFTGLFTFNTGNAISLPMAKAQAPLLPDWVHTNYEKGMEFMSQRDVLPFRNNARMPVYHRLDLGYHASKEKANGNVRTWIFSIYNVYNRLNPYVLNEENGKLVQYALFPIIPSVSYKLEF